MAASKKKRKRSIPAGGAHAVVSQDTWVPPTARAVRSPYESRIPPPLPAPELPAIPPIADYSGEGASSTSPEEEVLMRSRDANLQELQERLSELLLIFPHGTRLLRDFREAVEFRRAIPWLKEASSDLSESTRVALGSAFLMLRPSNSIPAGGQVDDTDEDRSFLALLQNLECSDATLLSLQTALAHHEIDRNETARFAMAVIGAIEQYVRRSRSGTGVDPW